MSQVVFEILFTCILGTYWRHNDNIWQPHRWPRIVNLTGRDSLHILPRSSAWRWFILCIIYTRTENFSILTHFGFPESCHFYNSRCKQWSKGRQNDNIGCNYSSLKNAIFYNITLVALRPFRFNLVHLFTNLCINSLHTCISYPYIHLSIYSCLCIDLAFNIAEFAEMGIFE